MFYDRYALLAEDDVNTVHLFVRVLSRHDAAAHVVTVPNGHEVLDFLRCQGRFSGDQHPAPAVIFLDVEMPGRDGLEVLQDLKTDEKLRTIPVVMVAGTFNHTKLQQSLELGANAFVVKPADFRRFAACVRTLVDFWLTLNEPLP